MWTKEKEEAFDKEMEEAHAVHEKDLSQKAFAAIKFYQKKEELRAKGECGIKEFDDADQQANDAIYELANTLCDSECNMELDEGVGDSIYYTKTEKFSTPESLLEYVKEWAKMYTDEEEE